MKKEQIVILLVLGVFFIGIFLLINRNGGDQGGTSSNQLEKISQINNSSNDNDNTPNIDSISDAQIIPETQPLTLSEQIQKCSDSEDSGFCMDNIVANNFSNEKGSKFCDELPADYQGRCKEMFDMNANSEANKEKYKKILQDAQTSDDKLLQEAIESGNKSLCDKISDSSIKKICVDF